MYGDSLQEVWLAEMNRDASGDENFLSLLLRKEPAFGLSRETLHELLLDTMQRMERTRLLAEASHEMVPAFVPPPSAGKAALDFTSSKLRRVNNQKS